MFVCLSNKFMQHQWIFAYKIRKLINIMSIKVIHHLCEWMINVVQCLTKNKHWFSIIMLVWSCMSIYQATICFPEWWNDSIDIFHKAHFKGNSLYTIYILFTGLCIEMHCIMSPALCFLLFLLKDTSIPSFYMNMVVNDKLINHLVPFHHCF